MQHPVPTNIIMKISPLAVPSLWLPAAIIAEVWLKFTQDSWSWFISQILMQSFWKEYYWMDNTAPHVPWSMIMKISLLTFISRLPFAIIARGLAQVPEGYAVKHHFLMLNAIIWMRLSNVVQLMQSPPPPPPYCWVGRGGGLHFRSSLPSGGGGGALSSTLTWR